VLTRRTFLLLPLALLLAPVRAVAEMVRRTTPYHANAAILFGLFTLKLDGVMEDYRDAAAGTYHVTLNGKGAGIENRFESRGVIRKGRLVPTFSAISFSVRGRENVTRYTYDWERGVAHYQHRSETFFLGHVREGGNTIPLPAGEGVDDFITVILNYGTGVFAEGKNRTFAIRRERQAYAGTDDVREDGDRGEFAPLEFTLVRDPASGRATTPVEFTTWSSWAKPEHPATFSFGADRRIERIDIPMILGTSLSIIFRART
jgi:hypothetical protein